MLRVVTANLFNGRADPRSLRRLITVEQPDVFAAQELAPNAARVLEEAFPYGVLDPRIDYHGRGLALRHPSAVETFQLEHRDGLAATLLPEAWPELPAPVEIISVHLANPILRPILRSIEVRRRQTEQIVTHVSRAPGPRLLVGDFNATPVWPVYRRLAAVMTDAARPTGSGARTWAPLWWMPRLLRIDHVFGEQVTPTRLATRRIRRSDHSAVVVDVVAGDVSRRYPPFRRT